MSRPRGEVRTGLKMILSVLGPGDVAVSSHRPCDGCVFEVNETLQITRNLLAGRASASARRLLAARQRAEAIRGRLSDVTHRRYLEANLAHPELWSGIEAASADVEEIQAQMRLLTLASSVLAKKP